MRRSGSNDSNLELVVADLTSDDGWLSALGGVEEVHHVASPIPAAQAKDRNDLIVPAPEGTLRVLRAARDVGVRRAVFTSSFAAVGYSPKAIRDYTETDWTNPDTPGLPPYPRSKTIEARGVGFHRGRKWRNPTLSIGSDIHPRPFVGDDTPILTVRV